MNGYIKKIKLVFELQFEIAGDNNALPAEFKNKE